jgi:ribosomal protein S18 acetylase RimI-like enzyme
MYREDWRDVGADVIAPLYGREQERWMRALGWDLSASFAVVETGRQAGRVPGWLLLDRDRRVHGWCFYILQDGLLQIGAIVADRANAVRELLGAILQSPEASLARRVSCFLFPSASSVGPALDRYHFDRTVTRYLVSGWCGDAPDPVVPEGCRARSWDRDRDLVPIVRLLARAYEGRPESSLFAPGGRLDEWAMYVAQLEQSGSFGTSLPDASCLVEDASSGRLLGVALATALSGEMAHLPQIAVDPAGHRRGLGRFLVTRVLSRAARSGYRQTSLLVDERNVPARSLYHSLGFEERERFVQATRVALRPAIARPSLQMLAGAGAAI